MLLRRALLLLLVSMFLPVPGRVLLAEDRVSLNAGSFETREEAMELLRNLQAQGRSPCLLKQEGVQGEASYTVQLGDYQTMAEALKAMREKRPEGVPLEIQVLDLVKMKKQRECFQEDAGLKPGERASLHVGRYDTREQALAMLYQLRSQGHAPCILQRKDEQGNREYTVQLADYATVEEALEALRMYRPEGVPCEVRVMDENVLLSQLDCSTSAAVNLSAPPDLEDTPVLEPAAAEQKVAGPAKQAAQPEKRQAGEEPPQGQVAAAPGPMKELEVVEWTEDEEDINVFRLAERERDLVTARTLAQNGYTAAAMSWYASLMERYPKDEEIRDYYIDTLIKNEEYAKALTLLNLWLEIDPDNVRALRLMAVMYTAMEEYESSFPYWERLHELRPYDMGFVVDHAFARRDHGDWMRSIELFSRALELDEDNTVAAEQLQELLKEHRPRYTNTFDIYLQAQNAETLTLAQGWGQHLTRRLWLDVFYDVMHFQRPRVNPATPPIDETLHDARFRLTWELDRDWDLLFGAGLYYVNDTSYSLETGFNWQMHEDGSVSGRIEYNRPWTEAIEAPASDGKRDTYRLTYEGFYNDRWQLTLGGLYSKFSVTDYDPYAWRSEVGGTLSRRISWRPDLWLSYGYLRRWDVYARQSRPLVEDPNLPGTLVPLADEVFRPVPLTAHEETHTLSALVEDWFCKYIGYSLSAGVYKDTFKDYPAFFVSPSLLLRLGQRADIRLGGSYTSDSDVPTGGETLDLSMDMEVTF